MGRRKEIRQDLSRWVMVEKIISDLGMGIEKKKDVRGNGQGHE